MTACGGTDKKHGFGWGQQEYENGYCQPTFAIQAGALRINPNSGPDGVGVQEGHAYTLEARAEVQAVCITGQVTHTLKAEGFDASEDGTGRGQPIVAHCRDLAQTITSNYGKQVDNRDTALGPNVIAVHGTQDPCVSTTTAFALGRNNGGENAVLSVSLRGREGGATAELGDEVGNCLRASGGGGDKAYGLALAFDSKESNTLCNVEVAPCLTTNGEAGKSGGRIAVQTAMQVRRLTPRECERLQGFPDDYTLIPWRKKPASECPDGPRYKALGNSWAVPCVRWIGRRLARHLEALA